MLLRSKIVCWLFFCVIIHEGYSAGPVNSANVTSASYLFVKAIEMTDVKLAVEAFQKKDLMECKRLLAQAKNLSSELPAPDLVLAQLIFEAGGVADAILLLDQYAVDSPSDPLTYILLGEIALKTRRLTDAWLNSEKSRLLAAEPSEELRIALNVLQGEIALSRNQWEAAERSFLEWEKIRPEDAASIWAQGRLKLMQDDLEGAKGALSRARKMNATLPQPQLFIANFLANKSENGRCEEWYREGLKSKDSTTENWQSYMAWLVSQGRSTDAGKLIDRIPKDMQEKREIRFLTALVERYLGNVT